MMSDKYLKAKTQESRCGWKYGVLIQGRWSEEAVKTGGDVIAKLLTTKGMKYAKS